MRNIGGLTTLHSTSYPNKSQNTQVEAEDQNAQIEVESLIDI